MKSKLLLLFLMMGPFLFAQEGTLPAPQASFMSLLVNDMDSSIQWYTKMLGFEQVNPEENPDRSFAGGFKQSNLIAGNSQLELIWLKGSISRDELLGDRSSKTKVTGFFKFGFTVNDFDKWIEHLKANNANMQGEVVRDPITNRRMQVVKDPDGNRIQLFEADEKEK